MGPAASPGPRSVSQPLSRAWRQRPWDWEQSRVQASASSGAGLWPLPPQLPAGRRSQQGRGWGLLPVGSGGGRAGPRGFLPGLPSGQEGERGHSPARPRAGQGRSPSVVAMTPRAPLSPTGNGGGKGQEVMLLAWGCWGGAPAESGCLGGLPPARAAPAPAPARRRQGAPCGTVSASLLPRPCWSVSAGVQGWQVGAGWSAWKGLSPAPADGHGVQGGPAAASTALVGVELQELPQSPWLPRLDFRDPHPNLAEAGLCSRWKEWG